MKRDILEKLGVPVEKWEEFRTEYWADVQKVAERKTRKQEKRKTDMEAGDYKAAILSMLKLIDEPARLQKILASVNNQYYKMGVGQDTDRERVQDGRECS